MSTHIVVPEWDVTDRLRKALRQAGMSSQDMADTLGVSRNTVSNYLGGHTRPSGPALRLWAMRTGVPLEWLRDGHDAGLPRLDSNQEPSVYRRHVAA